MPDRPNLTVIEGGFNYEDEVARLLEMPDAKQAMPLLKRLARRVRPAANSPFQVVGEDFSATALGGSDQQNNP